jgi:hypothetical protein
MVKRKSKDQEKINKLMVKRKSKDQEKLIFYKGKSFINLFLQKDLIEKDLKILENSQNLCEKKNNHTNNDVYIINNDNHTYRTYINNYQIIKEPRECQYSQEIHNLKIDSQLELCSFLPIEASINKNRTIFIIKICNTIGKCLNYLKSIQETLNALNSDIQFNNEKIVIFQNEEKFQCEMIFHNCNLLKLQEMITLKKISNNFNNLNC